MVFCGEFRSGSNRRTNTHIGNVYRTESNEYVIAKPVPFGNGNFEWISAPFKRSDLKYIGRFCGVPDYTAKGK